MEGGNSCFLPAPFLMETQWLLMSALQKRRGERVGCSLFLCTQTIVWGGESAWLLITPVMNPVYHYPHPCTSILYSTTYLSWTSTHHSDWFHPSRYMEKKNMKLPRSWVLNGIEAKCNYYLLDWKSYAVKEYFWGTVTSF